MKSQLKRSTIIVSFILITVSAYSQSPDLKNSLKFNIGPSGGLYVGNIWGGSFGGIIPMVGANAGLEYQRHFKNWLSFGVGLEYNLHRYGDSEVFTQMDSAGNTYVSGIGTYSLNHHYLGIPLRVHFNFLNKEKFKLYSFVGLSPKLGLDVVATAVWRSTNGNLIEGESASLNGMYGYGGPVTFKLEGQAGIGMNYKFAKHFFVDANFLFGMDCVSTGLFAGQYQYRFAGNAGMGYSF